MPPSLRTGQPTHYPNQVTLVPLTQLKGCASLALRPPAAQNMYRGIGPDIQSMDGVYERFHTVCQSVQGWPKMNSRVQAPLKGEEIQDSAFKECCQPGEDNDPMRDDFWMKQVSNAALVIVGPALTVSHKLHSIGFCVLNPNGPQRAYLLLNEGTWAPLHITENET